MITNISEKATLKKKTELHTFIILKIFHCHS